MATTRTRRTVMTIALTTALAVPTVAWATGGFVDVSPSDYFATAVQWAKDNGVTVGCNPPANTEFCPDDPVTRGQMAVFLHRLDANDVFLRPDELPSTPGMPGPIDADTLGGLDPTDLLPRFAVLEYNLNVATMTSGRGALAWSRQTEGRYVFTFDRDVSDCAWQVTPGVRNNAVFADGFSVVGFAHSVAGEPSQVRVQLHDQDGDEHDSSFNLTVLC